MQIKNSLKFIGLFLIFVQFAFIVLPPNKLLKHFALNYLHNYLLEFDYHEAEFYGPIIQKRNFVFYDFIWKGQNKNVDSLVIITVTPIIIIPTYGGGVPTSIQFDEILNRP